MPYPLGYWGFLLHGFRKKLVFRAEPELERKEIVEVCRSEL